jgi:hypothetical protein
MIRRIPCVVSALAICSGDVPEVNQMPIDAPPPHVSGSARMLGRSNAVQAGSSGHCHLLATEFWNLLHNNMASSEEKFARATMKPCPRIVAPPEGCAREKGLFQVVSRTAQLSSRWPTRAAGNESGADWSTAYRKRVGHDGRNPRRPLDNPLILLVRPRGIEPLFSP